MKAIIFLSLALSISGCAPIRTTLDDHAEECFSVGGLPTYSINGGGSKRFSCSR